MSERRSFVTEPILCRNCLQAVIDSLSGNGNKRIVWQQLHSHSRGYIPIIAGFIHESYAAEEVDVIFGEIAPMIERNLCHPVEFCVTHDSKPTEVVTISPLE